ncbi:right-handed parallel beta-helix repeat-containing protein [Streptomyces sp. BE20]|uniref:hypothetical protein n=1 Tax=unclassified Streptomyces TaxID=2593676 RepID=UPI002E7814F7|nr:MULTISPECIES: hypothetical protein [unclassified Streptomyces]MED7948779.1 right-handed parallel beta-helix repeat-containing protein [Streptomyces sp. BE303]MEE1821268.1 right-handed parallel beta-helix repeat-containing protein [Streptomyces sp. BE20]
MRKRRMALPAIGLLVGSLISTGMTVSAVAAGTTDFYASPTGSGTTCSSSTPCALTTARDKARAVAGSMSGDIRVLLRGGVYTLSEPLTLDVRDSGTNGHQVVYTAAPGEKPVFSGGQKVTGFSVFDSTKGIWRATLPAGALNAAARNSRDVSIDGVPAQRARTVTFSNAVWPTATGGAWTSVHYTAEGNAALSGIDFAQISSPERVEVVDNYYWKQLRCPLESITPTTVTIPATASTVPPFQPGGTSSEVRIKTNAACWANQHLPFPGYPFNGAGAPALSNVSWLENSYQFIDQPGEFYVDAAGGFLYYKPRSGENLATANVQVGAVEQLVSISGTPGHLAPVNATLSNTSTTGTVTLADDTPPTPPAGQAAGKVFGDLNHDALRTQQVGASFSYTFTGVGIDVLGEKMVDGGNLAVSIDGGTPTIVSNRGTTRLAQQVLFSARGLTEGTHTVKVVNQAAGTVRIDAFTVIPKAVQPVHDITFQGITFANTTWTQPNTKGFIDGQGGVIWDPDTHLNVRVPAAVQVHRGKNIVFAGNEFAALGGSGLDLADGTQNSTVTGNWIHDTGSNAVAVGEVDDYYLTDTVLMTSGNTITQNRVEHPARNFAGSVGIWAGHGRDIEISNNDVGHTPYSGISLGWGWGFASDCSMQAAEANQAGASPQWTASTPCTQGTIYSGRNKILNNYVHDVMGLLVDGGPIYVLGGQGAGADSRSVMAGNVVSGYNNAIGVTANKDLYIDEGSSYWDVYENVVRYADKTLWTRLWTPTIHDINVHDTYSSIAAYSTNGTNSTVQPATLVSRGEWPAAALAIIAAAGTTEEHLSPATKVDNDDRRIDYRGIWTAFGFRGNGDRDDNVHSTPENGSYALLTFQGTGVTFIGPKAPDQGNVEIYVDGVSKGLVNTYAASRTAQQSIYTVNGLTPGSHTIKIVKRTGAKATVDGFDITP